MHNPAKMALVMGYLDKSLKGGRSGISAKTMKEAADDLVRVLNEAFNVPRDQAFRLRMSNIGKPYCQLWLEKNKPDAALPMNAPDKIKFLIGDLTEIVVKAILKEVFQDDYTDTQRHELVVSGRKIVGHSDLTIDGAVDDVKSAADWSFSNKFENVETLAEHDHFGYLAQLLAYAKSDGLDIGGWWVVNKTTGELKYVEANSLTDEQKARIWAGVEETVRKLDANEPFERCFSDEPETFRRVATGRRVLPRDTPCRFCAFRYHCWPTLVERESLSSEAKRKPIEFYTELLTSD